jgi:hypothetical protein
MQCVSCNHSIHYFSFTPPKKIIVFFVIQKFYFKMLLALATPESMPDLAKHLCDKVDLFGRTSLLWLFPSKHLLLPFEWDTLILLFAYSGVVQHFSKCFGSC